jgi:hypothetical protein
MELIHKVHWPTCRTITLVLHTSRACSSITEWYLVQFHVILLTAITSTQPHFPHFHHFSFISHPNRLLNPKTSPCSSLLHYYQFSIMLEIVENSRAYPRMPSRLEYARALEHRGTSSRACSCATLAVPALASMTAATLWDMDSHLISYFQIHTLLR